MVREGHDVQVVDAAAGEDLTRLVLTQIIVQSAKEPYSASPGYIASDRGRVRQGDPGDYLEIHEGRPRYVPERLPGAGSADEPFRIYPDAYDAASGWPRVPWGSQPSKGSYRAGRLHLNGDETVGIGELKQRIEELETLVSVLGAGKTVLKYKGKPRRTG
jgi:hypothetical protein